MGLSIESLKEFITFQQNLEREERQRQREHEQEEKQRQREHEQRQWEYEQEEKQKQRELEIALAQLQLELHEKKLAAGKKHNLSPEDGDAETVEEGHDTSFKGVRGPTMPPFDDTKDNMDAFIHRFEIYASSQKWPEDKWAVYLSALLRGKALEVYSRLSLEDANDYDILKNHYCEGLILQRKDSSVSFIRQNRKLMKHQPSLLRDWQTTSTDG